MPQNIKLNYDRNIQSRLLFDKYFDFMLYKGEAYGPDNLSDMAIADFSDWYIENGRLYSSVIWPGAYNSGVTLNDIGLTGTDNGLITFDMDSLPNEKILEMMTGTTMTIDEGDLRFYMSPVTGNTKQYSYPMFLNDDEQDGRYISFKGGFWQGFYKLYGFDYQTLPNGPDIEWNLNFLLRPRTDYEEPVDSLNNRHPENNGIFFYIGTRAENKYWPFYATDSAVTNSLKEVPDEDNYFMNQCESGDTYNAMYNGIATTDYLADEEPEPVIPEPEYFIDNYVTTDESLFGVYDYTLAYRDNYFGGDGYFSEVYDIIPNELVDGYTHEDTYHEEHGMNERQHLWNQNNGEYLSDDTCEELPKPKCKGRNGGFTIWDMYTYGYMPDNFCVCRNDDNPDECDVTITGDCCCCNTYYNQCKNYFRDNYFVDIFECPDTNKAIEDGYVVRDLLIKPENIFTTNGESIMLKGYNEIETDNKFLIFDRTDYGFTTKTWDDRNDKITIYWRNDWGNINLFPLMNRTCTGWTTDTINRYYEENRKKYNIYGDLKNNIFALKVNSDGSIGYKYGVLDCDSEDTITHYSVKEEYSLPGIIKNDVWNSVVVKMKIINPTRYICDPFKGKRKMRIYIYVNGLLKLISKELTEPNFRALDEVYQKQEGVPYNISLGGGSQGLMEVIYPDLYNRPEYIFPIERDFGGTFIGDIKSFKIYDGRMRYLTIHRLFMLK